ncbi:hypothetical protein DSC45_18990 [Streptomyces sp. YIM 130001]|uniref:hypothetical protein n=1 Tax=Streptomyces sp. YIM 130001 TaxID=2259644 RepID=UPI000E65D9EB|nr:hypothetical protein [Streptomyces sp. YIM 130001]RII14983.1 hypothetical protein DSC45_18990 [Streptomyces sp. YIM 130001]
MPESTWQCSACSTFNDPGDAACSVCDTSRVEAEKRPPAKPTRPKPSPTPSRTTPAKSTPPRTPAPRKATPKRTPAPPSKRTPASKPPGKRTPAPKPATKRTDPPKRTSPGRTSSGAGAGRSSDSDSLSEILASLEWECPTCVRTVVGTNVCRFCHTVWTPALTSSLFPASSGASRASSSGRSWGPITTGSAAPVYTPVRPPTHEATRGEVVAGCGCLIVIAATVITLVVLLIVNWGSVISFFTGSDSDTSSPKPAPSASGPCPKQLASQLPKGSTDGARLVAAYSREGDNKERYAFCRTTQGKYFYFFQKKSDVPYGKPTLAKKTKDGYSLTIAPSSFRFRDGEITAYENGKESWKEKLIPESSTK